MSVLRVIYRTHPGANAKRRPAWFSKSLALQSLQESAARVGREVRWTFVADGAMTQDMSARVRPDDDVVMIRGGSASASLRRAVDVAVEVSARDPADTLYWFAEDDYLYRLEAMTQLVAAADLVGPSAYLTLYTCDITSWCAAHPSQPDVVVPAGERMLVDGVAWRRVGSTTSTMAIPRDALLADAGMVKFGTRAGAPFDLTTWSVLQGAKPYPWRHLLRDLDGYLSPRGVAKVVAKPPMRVVSNVVTAMRPQSRWRSLLAPVDDLAMHLETDVMPSGDSWQAVAAALQPGRREDAPGGSRGMYEDAAGK